MGLRTNRLWKGIAIAAGGAVALGLMSVSAIGQRTIQFENAAQSREALQQALAQQRAAAARAQELSVKARNASAAAERTAQEAAALAARIQQSEAGIAAGEARLALIREEQTNLRGQMAEREGPVVGLTAALQKFARRPATLSIVRPGSVRDLVYVRAILDSAVPEVARRTQGLRAQLNRSRELQREASQAIAALRDGEDELSARRKELAALETSQRIASREASGNADREAERALALAENARDLSELVGELDKAAEIRRKLASLPGPVLRPAQPARAQTSVANATPAASATAPPEGFRLPVDGRTAAGFGTILDAGTRSQGITLVPRASAQIVAPAGGRVAFAGPYRGYGRIVIIEHEGGWTSLITGLVRTDVVVGDNLVGGSPLGIAAPDAPSVTLELRRDGELVNPLDFVG